MEVVGYAYPTYKPSKRIGCDSYLLFALKASVPTADVDVYQMTFNDVHSEVRQFLKYDYEEFPSVNKEAADWADEMLLRELEPMVSGWRVQSLNEAITQSVPQSSPGEFYRVFAQNHPTKGDVLVGNWEPKVPLPDDCKTVHLRLAQSLLKGEVPDEFPIWTNAQKVELVDEDKFDDRRFRLINFPPIDLYLAQICFFGDFAERLKESIKLSQVFNPYALAFSPFYGGIQALSRSFPKGWVFDDDDISAFDSRCLSQLMLRVLYVMCQLMDSSNWEKYSEVYEFLWLCEIFGPVLLSNGQLIRKFLGRCTGSFITSLLNTLIRRWAFFYCWYRLVGPSVDVHKHTREKVLGDDELTAVHPDYSSAFSLHKRAEIQRKELGWLPKEQSTPSKSLEGHAFLGMRWRRVGGKLLPSYSSERIIVGAVRPRKLDPELSGDRIANLAYLSYNCEPYQGREVYDVLHDLWNASQRRCPGATLFPTREEVKALWSGLESSSDDSRFYNFSPVSLEVDLNSTPQEFSDESFYFPSQQVESTQEATESARFQGPEALH